MPAARPERRPPCGTRLRPRSPAGIRVARAPRGRDRNGLRRRALSAPGRTVCPGTRIAALRQSSTRAGMRPDNHRGKLEGHVNRTGPARNWTTRPPGRSGLRKRILAAAQRHSAVAGRRHGIRLPDRARHRRAAPGGHFMGSDPRPLQCRRLYGSTRIRGNGMGGRSGIADAEASHTLIAHGALPAPRHVLGPRPRARPVGGVSGPRPVPPLPLRFRQHVAHCAPHGVSSRRRAPLVT